MAASAGTTRPGRILVVRLGAIGDVVNALVVATALRRNVPGVHIGWAVHELALPLVEGHPAIDRVHLWRRGTGLAGFRGLVREVRGERYDLAIDLQRLAKSAGLARLSGAARVLGYDRARTKEASWVLTGERLAPGDGGAHMVEQYLDVLRHLGADAGAPEFVLPADAGAEARAAELLPPGDAPIVLNLGASKPANRWPPGRFGEIALRLLPAGRPVVLTGGPGDREAAGSVRAAAPGVVDLVGATGLLELAAVLRRAAVVVSADTGPLHLASAVGATVVALFGAADPRRTGPWGERHVVLRSLPECAPCGLRRCDRPRHVCMEDLDPERVEAAVGEVLARAPG